MTKRSILRWTGGIVGGALVLVMIGAASAYGISSRHSHAKFDVPEHAFTVTSTPESIERGLHIVTIRGCNECHAKNLAGSVMVDDPAFGYLVAANLTSGRKGGALTDRDWERAVRHGVRRDSTPLTYMPAHEFTGFSDEDLNAIVSYARSVPPVTDTWKPSHIGPVARALYTAGQLILYPAEKINHSAAHPASVVPVVNASYGKYMAAGCVGCHNESYSGGRIVGGPPDWPPAANLTPTGLAGRYDEEKFIATIRSGKKPDGTPLRLPMDSKIVGVMTDVEIKSVWAFLQTLPPKEMGAK